jgi:1-acyl-sn-glycerol-3-phosphate acyltransferase/thymidylate kinase
MNAPSRISRTAVVLNLILLRPFMKLFCGINVSGRENLEGLDQFIIIANHNSHLDVQLLYYLLPVRMICRTHPVADQPYFARSRVLYGLVNFMLKPIWITRVRPHPDGDPLDKIKSAIDDGCSVIMFPEGTRGKPGEIEHFHSGIGRLMVQYPHLSIIPAFLTGPERALPKTSALLLPLWNNIIVGPPQKCVGSYREITQQLESVLFDLSKSEQARRHKRRSQAVKSARCLAILGIDGSGKSTISKTAAQHFSESMRVCLVSDELRVFENGQARELQPLLSENLRQRIGAYAKTVGSLKQYKIPKLAELLLRDRLLHEARRWYSPDLIVMDSSPLLNLLAWSVLYEPEELDNATCSTLLGILSGLTKDISRGDKIFTRFPELARMKQLGLTHLSLPDMVILIDIDSATACRRIEARGQQRQVHETEEKLDRLRRAYLQVCEVVQTDWRVPTRILNGGQPLDSIMEQAIQFASAPLAAKEE